MTLKPRHLLMEILSAFALVSASVSGAHAAVSAVPAGFEDLVRGQTEHLEVRLYGRSLGVFSALVKPGVLQFDNPEAIAETAVQGAIADPQLLEALTQALAVELPRNGQLICAGSPRDSDASFDLAEQRGELMLSCNHIETPTAAIIYDERNGVVNLFLARTWAARMPQISPTLRRYHQVSKQATNALLHTQSLQWSASGKNQRTLSARGVGALGVTERGHLGGAWRLGASRHRYGRYSETEIESLYFRHDMSERYYLQAGRMDQRNLASAQGGNFGFSLLPLPSFDGARIGTTNAYLNAALVDNATTVTVMLNTAARVEIYRGEQLLLTQFVEAGVQRLDTRTLPEGSYLLSLRIIENGVHVRTEQMPFSKTGGGFDTGGTQWFVQGGRVLTSGSYARGARNARHGDVVQAGVKTGLFDQILLTGGLSSVGGRMYTEARIDWQKQIMSGTLTASAAYFAGTDGTRGNTQTLSYYNGLGMSLYRYQLRSPNADRMRASALSMGNYDSINASLSGGWGQWTFGTGYTYSKSPGRPLFGGSLDREWDGSPRSRQMRRDFEHDRVSHAVQVSASRSFSIQGATVNARIGGYRTDTSRRGSDTGVFVGLSLYRSSPGNDAGRSASSSAGVDIRSQRDRPLDVNYSAGKSWAWRNGTYRELDVSAGGFRTERFFGQARGRLDSRFGRLDAGISHGYDRRYKRQDTAFAGGYASTIAVSGSGVYLGPDGSGSLPGAAFAVHVIDDPEYSGETVAQIVGGGSNNLTLAVGQRALLAQEGYATGRAEIIDATSAASSGSISLGKGAGARQYFLSPGKLLTQEVAASVTYTYLGRGMSADGRPLAGARVLNVPSIALDSDGGFVLEVDARLSMLYLLHDGQIMQLPLVVQGKRDIVQYVGESVAVPIAQSALPQHIRSIPRVSHMLSDYRAGIEADRLAAPSSNDRG